MTDREKLAREIREAFMDNARNTAPSYAAADIAIAYADRRVAEWMGNRSYATGHGDTVEDMLAELEAQAKERALSPARAGGSDE